MKHIKNYIYPLFVTRTNFHSGDRYRIIKAHGTAENIEHFYTGNTGVKNKININGNSGYLEFEKDKTMIERKRINNGNF